MRYNDDGDFEKDYYDEEEDAQDRLSKNDARMIADQIAEGERLHEEKFHTDHIKVDLLEKAISISKSSWLWWFLSHDKKLELIMESYSTLECLMIDSDL